jgi:DNA-binding protein HU-beta
MNKGDLIDAVAKVVGTKNKAQQAVDCVFGCITEALKNEESVQIIGFGSFKTSQRAARTGRNPQTGDPINIPARTVPKFVPGKALKDAVN